VLGGRLGRRGGGLSEGVVVLARVVMDGEMDKEEDKGGLGLRDVDRW